MTTLRMVSKNRYSALELSKIAHRAYNDMELIPVEIVDLGSNMQAVKTIRDKDFSFYEDALTATEQENPADIFPFSELFGAEAAPIYVISNKRRFYGAIALLYPSVQTRLREIMGDEFVIIPSSVHEVLAIPAHFADIVALPGMVRAINNEQVDKEEWLAETAYFARFNRFGEMYLEDVKNATGCMDGCTNACKPI